MRKELIVCLECRQKHKYPAEGFPVCRLARSIKELVGQQPGNSLKNQKEKETVPDAALFSSAVDWPGIDQ